MSTALTFRSQRPHDMTMSSNGRLWMLHLQVAGKPGTFMGMPASVCVGGCQWRRGKPPGILPDDCVTDGRGNGESIPQSFRLLTIESCIHIATFLIGIDEVDKVLGSRAILRISDTGMHHMNFKLYGFIILFVSSN